MLNWIQVVWLAITCIAAILGIFHLLVWTRQRSQIQHAIVSAMSFVVAFSAVAGMREFTATSPAVYAESLRWSHTLASIVTVLVVAYVQLTAPARLRLGIAVCVVRVAAEIANQTTGVSMSFLTIDELRPILSWDGVSFMSPVGQANPWYALAQFGNLLLLIYLVDVLVKLGRQPRSEQRRRNLQSIGALLFLLVFSAGAMLLVVTFKVPVPSSLSLAFLGFALVMNHHISGDLLRAAELARNLRIAESNLRGAEHSLKLAEQSVGLGQWRWDAKRRQVTLSPSCARILGRENGGDVDVDELMAQVDPPDRLGLRDFVADQLHGAGREFNGQIRIHAPDGSVRPIAMHGTLVVDDRGAPVQAQGVVIDLGRRQGVEEVFGLVFAASPIALLLVDTDGLIVLSNSAATELSGYPPEELRGLSVDTLVPPAQRSGHSTLRSGFADSATRRPMASPREVYLRTRSGADVLVEVTLNPIAVDGQAMVIAVIHDTRERREREREQAMQRAALAHVARVGMLAELSGSLAHEINQPLAAILSNAQASLRFVARPEPELGEVTEGLREIVDNAKRAGEVIRRMRAMLRNEPPEFTVLDVNEKVRSVVHLLHSELIERGVAVAVDCAAGLPRVNGDRVQLQQVLLNLIVNAADAMEGVEPPRRLHIRTRLDQEGVLIDVSDRGRGVPEADRERIFQAFVSSKASGLGFGLALSKTLVEAHGGRIWVTDNPPPMPGACFHVWLPAAG